MIHVDYGKLLRRDPRFAKPWPAPVHMQEAPTPKFHAKVQNPRPKRMIIYLNILFLAQGRGEGSLPAM